MLNVNVRDDYLVVGALGWFPNPNVYYKVLDYPYAHRYAVIEKDFEEDPGRLLWAVHYPFPRYLYSAMDATPDSVYVDGKGNFLSMEGEGDLGMEPPKGIRLPRFHQILCVGYGGEMRLSLRFLRLMLLSGP